MPEAHNRLRGRVPIRKVGDVGKAAAARKLASAAAFGGGGLSVLGAGLYGVLTAEAKLARRAIGNAKGRPPDATGWYGRGRPGPGDQGGPPGRLQRRRVRRGAGSRRFPARSWPPGSPSGPTVGSTFASIAAVGAQSSDLERQVDRALPIEPDVAVILVGANDVTHTVLPSQAVRHLGEAVRRLRERDVAVLVGTCPDLGTIKPIAPPLKQVARSWSRRLAAAQTITVVEAGGRTVSLGSILGPEFAAAPALLFGPDRFHPSADGYASLAGVLLPSTLAALGLIPEDEAQPEALRGEGVLPVAAAAVEAVEDARHRARRRRGRRRPTRRTRTVGRAAAPPPAPADRRPRRPTAPRRGRAEAGPRTGSRTSTAPEPHPEMDSWK